MPNTKNGVQAAHPHRQNSSDYFEFPLDNPRTKGYYNKVLRGGVAQLGARLNGIQKARGSSPLISTILQTLKNRYFKRFFFYFFAIFMFF